uniref:Uncharacterized protein n=1 Tax=Rhizophora mucronata TaxID=61149 RepID=A0A2P2NNX6_RHIMU
MPSSWWPLAPSSLVLFSSSPCCISPSSSCNSLSGSPTCASWCPSEAVKISQGLSFSSSPSFT